VVIRRVKNLFAIASNLPQPTISPQTNDRPFNPQTSDRPQPHVKSSFHSIQ